MESKSNILVVDDNPDKLNLIKAALALAGYNVTTATDGDEALTAIESYQPDLVITDVMMPRMNGYELMARVRSLPPERGGATPAIALTAFARSEDRARSLLAGFQMHLAKPVEIGELLAGIVSLSG